MTRPASLRGLAATLRARPSLAHIIAARLDQIAEDLADAEAAQIPPHLLPPIDLPAGVVSLAERRRRAG